MLNVRSLLPLLLTLPITLTTLPGCARTVEVPVVEPAPLCPLPAWDEPPTLTAETCGDKVCLPWQQARDLGQWIGEARRWHDMAQLCIEAVKPFQRPTPAALGTQQQEDRASKILQSGVYPLITGMTLRGMDVKVGWQTCGQVNGYYDHSEHQITLCYELLDLSPGFVRFVVAHEMSHAIIMQLGIPYTGLHEMAADELASVVLHLLDRQPDILEAAEYFRKLGRPESPWDPHPSDLRRFVLLSLLANDTAYFDHAMSAWAVLLADYR